MYSRFLNRVNILINEQTSIAPLVVFRIVFAALMLLSILRFTLNGWIYKLYIKPVFYFSYYGFDWVKPLGDPGMYILFSIMALAAFGILVGFAYRISAILFFITFTYVELIDKTNYLNHYYFVSIIAFLMILLPAGKYFSIDILFKPQQKRTHIPRVFISVLQLQLGLVYFFAGLAKINYDWLIEAMPLRIWLPAHTDLFLIGTLLDKVWVAYAFSWFGALYDLSIPFLLVYKKTRNLAYFFVVVFHLMTYFLFQIGMFPYIMIVCTLIFFPETTHLRFVEWLQHFFTKMTTSLKAESPRPYVFQPIIKRMFLGVFITHFIIQLILPFRFLLYPGKLFWTEQGYRFSWRVMLMEKAGKAFFYVTDPEHHLSAEAMMNNSLTANQEKMMATQPDMILQYAHFLQHQYEQQGVKHPEIRVECYVTLNGSGSRLLINKNVDLTKEQESFKAKGWILPFEEKRK